MSAIPKRSMPPFKAGAKSPAAAILAKKAPAAPAKPAPPAKKPAPAKPVAAPAILKARDKDPIVRATTADLDDLLAGIRGEGDETAMYLGSDSSLLKIRGVISTQCPGLDRAIGRGGIPLARLTILHGAEGSGKTTACLHLVAEVQRMGGVAIYMDKEYKLDPDYAAALGVDTKRLIISQPSYLEQAFKVQEAAIKRASAIRERLKRRVPILVVLDSMNAAITKAQLEGEWDDKHMAPQARAFSEGLPKLIPQVSREDVALCYISQVRKKMNISFGDDDEICGGKAPRFYASLIISFKRIGSVKTGDEKVANTVIAECKKNQIAPPFKQAQFNIRYGIGIDAEMSLLEEALEMKLVEKNGAWYSFNGERIASGAVNAADKLRERPDMAAEIAAAGKIPWRT
jgi:recombination protein RecA